MAKANSDLQIHYQIRANFSRAQLGRMRKGGLYSVQPGIESLSTNILKSMRKMSTGMRHVELIKWCTYYGINDTYNILMRFPGETAEDYRMQADLVPKIVHFQPPYGIVKARVDRGSPMFTDPETQSITRLTPADCYEYLFPKRFNLERVSYYFEPQMDNIVDEAHYDDLLDRVADWQSRWAKPNPPFLRYRKAVTSIVVEDGRKRRRRVYSYSNGRAVLYEYCADARTLSDITRDVGTGEWVRDALEEFVQKDLMLFMDGRYLSLALPANPNFELASEHLPTDSEGSATRTDVGLVPLVALTRRRER